MNSSFVVLGTLFYFLGLRDLVISFNNTCYHVLRAAADSANMCENKMMMMTIPASNGDDEKYR